MKQLGFVPHFNDHITLKASSSNSLTIINLLQCVREIASEGSDQHVFEIDVYRCTNTPTFSNYMLLYFSQKQFLSPYKNNIS